MDKEFGQPEFMTKRADHDEPLTSIGPADPSTITTREQAEAWFSNQIADRLTGSGLFKRADLDD